MNLFYQPLIPEGILYLDPEESRHCTKVLRKKPGDRIRITDGKGVFYEAIILKTDDRQCSFEIEQKIEEPARHHSIHIAISPTKNPDRIEWFVEKAIEFGVDKISLMACEHTERTHLKNARLEKIAVSAMKQSLNATLPVIQGIHPFTDIVASAQESGRFTAYVDGSNPHHLKDVATREKSCLILIGPEGDFTQEELGLALQHNFQKVSLGQSRLRTETAGLAACHILNLINS
jgi:16S rRNA (uracil1498-N3)-methyltransferase